MAREAPSRQPQAHLHLYPKSHCRSRPSAPSFGSSFDRRARNRARTESRRFPQAQHTRGVQTSMLLARCYSSRSIGNPSRYDVGSGRPIEYGGLKTFTRRRDGHSTCHKAAEGLPGMKRNRYGRGWGSVLRTGSSWRATRPKDRVRLERSYSNSTTECRASLQAG